MRLMVPPAWTSSAMATSASQAISTVAAKRPASRAMLETGRASRTSATRARSSCCRASKARNTVATKNSHSQALPTADSTNRGA